MLLAASRDRMRRTPIGVTRYFLHSKDKNFFRQEGKRNFFELISTSCADAGLFLLHSAPGANRKAGQNGPEQRAGGRPACVPEAV
ncbi:MAG: hypothetical protein OZSIB_0419 [Candidatus Ozemobacter sibiricus]|uniref:Uncharacterized protein n=1 Tax=Candidatus Ozemobacter sibiricus TaxID=2268124 RepID=A0A367ZMK3_9BACT|nr:MAG: hypothetical protein OZSIB_0419 [Candidatus Ozemobacter sibiricus]